MTDSTNRSVPPMNGLRPRQLAVSARRLPVLAAVTALGLVLAGCAASADAEDGESSSAAPSSASGAGKAPTPSADGATGGGSPSGAASSAVAAPYEPASSTAPAKNVPVPEMPEAVKEPTEDGADAAVEYWWRAIDYLKASGDSGPIKSVSKADCVLCQRQVEIWEWVYNERGWADADRTKVRIGTSKLDSDELTGTFVAQVTEAPVQVFQPNGSLVQGASSDRANSSNWTGAVVFDAQSKSWKMSTLEVMGTP
jgi:hypothetical protein